MSMPIRRQAATVPGLRIPSSSGRPLRSDSRSRTFRADRISSVMRGIPSSSLPVLKYQGMRKKFRSTPATSYFSTVFRIHQSRSSRTWGTAKSRPDQMAAARLLKTGPCMLSSPSSHSGCSTLRG